MTTKILNMDQYYVLIQGIKMETVNLKLATQQIKHIENLLLWQMVYINME